MVLPALFAACTNDDFETVQNNSLVDSVLKNRAKGELILNASKAGEEDAQTRIVGTTNGTGIDWLWENAEDKIGGVVVDYKAAAGSDNVRDIATAGENYTITNYPFAPNINAPSASAEFSTPTTVVQGAYMFYNLYDGNNTKRGQIKAEIDRIQKVNAGEEAGLKQVGTTSNGGQNFFVSPIMDMAIADGEPIETPVTLTSAHSVLKFTFKADLEEKYWGNFTVNKVVIKGKDNNNKKFARTLTINPQAIAKIQLGIKEAYVNGEQPYLKWFKGNGAIVTRNADGTMVSDDQIKAALKLVTDAISLKDKNNEDKLREIGTLDDYCNDLQFQLETPYVFNSKDDVMELMVVVPAGKYTQDDFKVALNDEDNITEGLFELNVYTSEGIYKTYLNSYDEDGNMVEARTLERGKKYGMPEQTLIINGGYTNITLFDQNDEFTVETTEDWNYTIDYINAHYRDFGNNNAWKTPLVKIAEKSEITVDADHYFPAFPVKYEGAADLYLVGQNEYKFNPTCAILDDTNRPTLYVVDQKNASVVFDMDVKEDIKDFYGKDGVAKEDAADGVQQTITSAIKLISDAQVVIKKGTEVQFEALENNGTMTIEEDVKVEVLDDNSDKTQAILLADATNKGVMNIYGRLSGNYALANAATATINVKGFENNMNNKIRGIVDLKQLDNDGIINIESGVQYKGTYGGKVDVETLNNNYATNGLKKGEINNNGELMVGTINSNGTITVGKDPYALIQLALGSVTDNDGYGSVVLADATQYEVYDTYYSQISLIATDVRGTVQTTLTSQEEYDEVVKNHEQYKAIKNDLQTALEVLNKVTVKDVVLELADKATNLYADINFFLGDNAGLDIKNVDDITLGSITANGTNTSVIATIKGEDAKNIVNVGSISSFPNADLTIDKKVKVMVNERANIIQVYGKLTNNGWINTEASTVFGIPNTINAIIYEGGSLINNGLLSQKATNVYSMEDTKYAELSNFINDNFTLTEDGWQGTTAGIRIEFFAGVNLGSVASESWQNTNEAVTPELFAKLFTSGSVKSIQGYKAYCVARDGGVYALYFANNGNDPLTNSRKYRFNTSVAYAAEVLAGAKAMPTDAKTWFYVTENYGTINLTEGKAWGEIAEGMNFGAKYGDFENDK